jgi:multidrug efflux system membrane fusion protein
MGIAVYDNGIYRSTEIVDLPMSFIKTVLFVFFLTFAFLLTGCKGDQKGAAKGKGGRGDMPTPVTVGHATQRDVPIQAEVIGSVEASAAVSLKPQISGQVLEAKFREGDFVKQGQLLAMIDPRAFEAQLNQLEAQIQKDQAALAQSEAALARDRAQEANAKGQLDRAVVLYKQGVVSKEQYEQYVANEGTYTATITADLAAIENAKAQIAASKAAVENQKVQLGYTKIFAPITGRTGSMTVKPGNIVTANTTELATINQVEPVFVTFALPEANLPALRQHTGQKLPVSAVPEEGGIPQIGTLAFFENSVDAMTGTVKVKATFENHNHNLWPGQFVRVTLKLGDHPNAILVPSQAVQSGQDGTFVYVVKSDQRVELRQVTTSQRLGDETVIEGGVKPGDTVVTEGTLRLIPGARVQVRARGQGGRGAPARAAGPGGPEGPAGAAEDASATPTPVPGTPGSGLHGRPGQVTPDGVTPAPGTPAKSGWQGRKRPS